MKLYQDNNGIWHYDTTTLVAGDLRLKDMGEEGIRLYWGNSKQPIFRGDVDELEREDGSPYEDVETLLSECKDFFVNPLNPLAEEVEGLKVNKADLVNGKVPAEQLPSSSAPIEYFENAEHATADALNYLLGRIQALEEFIEAKQYGEIQADKITVLNEINFNGADMYLEGTGAPSFVPDRLHQRYIDTSSKIAYTAVGTLSSADWKRDTTA